MLLMVLGKSDNDVVTLCMTLARIVASLIHDETDAIANMANTSAAIYQNMADINWVGFYITRAEFTLVLGPFQGKPACLRIPFGRGVCGKAAQQQQTLIVPDVDVFDDHIVCDSASKSELVVPVLSKGAVVAVLDIDSASKNRFAEADAAEMEQIAMLIANGCAW